jgi:hypothetical protein
MLRCILGCLKSTPILLIQIETGISPIKDRWDMIATRYLSNLSTKRWNSAYPSLYNLAQKKRTWKHRSTPAASQYLNELDGGIRPGTLQVPTYQPYTEPLVPWQLFQIDTESFATDKKTAVKNKALTAATFLEDKNIEDNNYLEVYTDGSTCSITKQPPAQCIYPQHKQRSMVIIRILATASTQN